MASSSTASPPPSARRCTFLHVWVSEEAHAAIAAKAARWRMDPNRFSAALLEVIARDDMFDAVIDTEPNVAPPKR